MLSKMAETWDFLAKDREERLVRQQRIKDLEIKDLEIKDLEIKDDKDGLATGK